MPEYFDISLIGKRADAAPFNMQGLIKQLGLIEGENTTKFFGGKKIVVSIIDHEKSDFVELSLGLTNQHFCEENFDSELHKIADFINHCFLLDANLQLALCSYEMNGYFLGQIMKFDELIEDEKLNCFPIVFRRFEGAALPKVKINLNAQDLFDD